MTKRTQLVHNEAEAQGELRNNGEYDSRVPGGNGSERGKPRRRGEEGSRGSDFSDESLSHLLEMLAQGDRRLTTGYDGRGSPERLLTEIELYKGRWEDRRLLLSVKVALKGRALAWFKAFVDVDCTSVEEFLELFRDEFEKKEDNRSWNFYKAVVEGPRPREEPVDFIYRIAELGAKEKATVVLPAVKSMLPSHLFDELEKSEELSWMVLGKFFKRHESEIKKTWGLKQARGQQNEVARTEARDARSRANAKSRAGIVCFLCKKEGHIRRDCPDKKKLNKEDSL